MSTKISVKCLKCGHAWDTKSKLVYVSCPSCHTPVKVRNP